MERATGAANAASRAAAGDVPEELGLAVLGTLVRSSLDGIAVLDAGHRYLYVNPAGCRILNHERDDLIGRPADVFAGAPLSGVRASETAEGGLRRTVLVRRDGQRELEWAKATFEASGRRLTSVTFRDVTTAQHQQRQLVAFARAASSISMAESLETALARIASEVRSATGIASCLVLLGDARTHELQAVGTAGYPEDFVSGLPQAQRSGASMMSMQVFNTKKPEVIPDRISQLLADPQWAPWHEMFRTSSWGTLVSVPLRVRDKAIGALTAFYPEGQDPTEEDLSFFETMADQVAVAAENKRLVAELESKVALEERHRLARDLHDSVSQALFSMTLHTRAVELALAHEGGDPRGRIASGLGELRQLTQAALAEMRALIFELRPGALQEEGLVAAVRKHAAAVAAREGLDVRVEATRDEFELGPDAAEQLYRLVQEALHNVVKHANAHSATIRVRSAADEADALIVEVIDDGAGFDPGAPYPGHLGLPGMHQRARRLGGRLEVVSSAGAGTTVRATIPGTSQRTSRQPSEGT